MNYYAYYDISKDIDDEYIKKYLIEPYEYPIWVLKYIDMWKINPLIDFWKYDSYMNYLRKNHREELDEYYEEKINNIIERSKNNGTSNDSSVYY